MPRGIYIRTKPSWKRGLTKDDPRVAQYWLGRKQSPEHIEKRRQLLIGQRRTLSEEAKRNMSIARDASKYKYSGENSPMWIKDRTKLVQKQERNDYAYKEWRKNVRNRDNWICKIADENCDGKVVAHHILPWAKFPELRYKINNGITLCRFHHPKKRKDEMMLSPYFQELVRTNV